MCIDRLEASDWRCSKLKDLSEFISSRVNSEKSLSFSLIGWSGLASLSLAKTISLFTSLSPRRTTRSKSGPKSSRTC